MASANGIWLVGSRSRASDNHVAGNGGTNGTGIHAGGASIVCMRNSATGFATNISATCNSMDNLTPP